MARMKTPETTKIRQQIVRLSDAEIEQIANDIVIIQEVREAEAEKMIGGQ